MPIMLDCLVLDCEVIPPPAVDHCLRGRVTNNGEPAPGHHVIVTPGGITQTDDNGEYCLPVPAGTTITVEIPGCGLHTLEVPSVIDAGNNKGIIAEIPSCDGNPGGCLVLDCEFGDV